MDKEISKKENLPLLLTVALVVTFLLVFAQTLISLAKGWSASDDYSHGFLIIPICLYVVWQKKDFIVINPKAYSKIGLLGVVISLCLFIVARLSGIISLESISLVFFIGGTVAYLLGPKNFKTLLFPIFFLLLMIPVPSQIYSAATIPLQLFVTKTSTLFLNLIDIPVFREGNVIQLPGHTLEVVQACSGLRSMISLFTLSLLFGYFTLRSNILRVAILLTSVPIAIVINVFRVTSMGISFHNYNFDLTKGAAHTILGILLFAVSIMLLYLFQRLLKIWDTQLT